MKMSAEEAGPILGLTWFDGTPAGAAPSRLASPFRPGPPDPWACEAAQVLQRRLRRDAALEAALWRPGGGKMFGVLVVADARGRMGFLSAFSGMLGGAWNVEGFVPPLFDPVARDAFWPAGEAELAAMEERHAELLRKAEALRAASRSSKVREVEARRKKLEHERAERSRALWREVTEGYVIPDARGEVRTLASLFAPRPPPGGAGDCAAPKLLAQAFRHHLKPLALAEFWWGTTPLDGRRESGAYYPACDNKCGTVLPYMLRGLSVEPWERPVVVVEDPRVVHEDRWLLVVDKPVGMPTLPGRHEPGRDSVLTRLVARFPELSAASFLHDLEPQASGLLLVARDPATRAALQRQSSRGEVMHRHVSWVDGRVEGDSGVIELSLRVTAQGGLEEQVDARAGRRTASAWRVLAREAHRTRVEWLPTTLPAPSLRIHSAHRLGLGFPLVGDARFGREDARLMLHADVLAFVHPHSGERLEFASAAPF
jgi:tRNA pseudouridine32 synthase / 23S rRNA pseudouridine746 synthase